MALASATACGLGGFGWGYPWYGGYGGYGLGYGLGGFGLGFGLG